MQQEVERQRQALTQLQLRTGGRPAAARRNPAGGRGRRERVRAAAAAGRRGPPGPHRRDQPAREARRAADSVEQHAKDVRARVQREAKRVADLAAAAVMAAAAGRRLGDRGVPDGAAAATGAGADAGRAGRRAAHRRDGHRRSPHRGCSPSAARAGVLPPRRQDCGYLQLLLVSRTVYSASSWVMPDGTPSKWVSTFCQPAALLVVQVRRTGVAGAADPPDLLALGDPLTRPRPAAVRAGAGTASPTSHRGRS